MKTDNKENCLDIPIYAIPTSPVLNENAKSNTRQAWWHIDKGMVRFKIHYLLFIGALGSTMPFITIFAKHRIGLTATSLAAILITQKFIFVFTKPLMGYLADYFNKLKAMICSLMVIAPIFLFLLLAIPNINVSQVSENDIHSNSQLTLADYKNKICTLSLENETFVVSLKNNVVCSFGAVKQTNLDRKRRKRLTNHLNSTASFQSRVDSSNKEDQDVFSLDEIISAAPSNRTNFHSTICCDITNVCQIGSCTNLQTNSGKEASPDISQFETYLFWLFAIVLTFAQAATNAIFTLSDTACCESAVKTGADLGRQRLFGAIGWGMMSPIGGVLNDYTGDYLPGWIVTGVLLAMSLWNLWKIDLVQPQFSQNILKDVGTVLKSREFLTFQMGVLMNGMGIGIMWSYHIWFLTTIGASRFLCGLVQTVQCFAGEIPFMFFSGWFLKKLGHFNVLTLALMAYCVRFFWYSYLENPWLVLPLECLRGFTYGLLYPAVATYGKLSSKPGTEATTQSILFSTHEGLGAGLGCVLAGIGFDIYGGRKTFFYASIIAACGMLINIIFTLWNRKQNSSKKISPIPA